MRNCLHSLITRSMSPCGDARRHSVSLTGLRRGSLRVRVIACVAIIGLLAPTLSGCAAIFRGGSQRVTVVTNPPGRTVMYEGQTVSDGDSVIVRKSFDTPRFDVGKPGRPSMVNMTYNPDLWLIGDAAFFLLGIIPGLIAGGIDFATGAWRNLDPRQFVTIPDPASS